MMDSDRDTVARQLEAAARQALDRPGDLPQGPLAEVFDSMELMTLVVAIEDHFKIILEPEDEARMITLEDCVEVIVTKLAERHDAT